MMSNATSKFDATVADGVRHYQDYQRGSTAELDRFAKLYLTAKGQEIVTAIRANATEQEIRSEMTRAVQAAY